MQQLNIPGHDLKSVRFSCPTLVYVWSDAAMKIKENRSLKSGICLFSCMISANIIAEYRYLRRILIIADKYRLTPTPMLMFTGTYLYQFLSDKARYYRYFWTDTFYLECSVADPWNFGMDPDPAISSVTFKTSTKKCFCLLLFLRHLCIIFKDKKS